MSTPVAGWYPAPDRVGEMRYWDGVQWTDQYQAVVSQTPLPSTFPPPSAGAQWWPQAGTPARPQAFYSSPTIGDERRYAGFWQRAGAAVIDGILYWVLYFILIFLLGDFGDFVYIFAVLGVEWWFYSAGWSPGRAALGIRIVDEFGGQPGAKRGFRRLLMSFVSSLALAIGYLALLWSPTKQTWHDRVAGTYVVRAD